MSGSRLRGGGLVLVSLAMHAVVIVGVSTLALRTPIAPLFVDLTQDGRAPTENRPDESAAISSRPGPAAVGAPARRAATASPGGAASIPAAPAPPPVTERPPEASASTAAAPWALPPPPTSSPAPGAPTAAAERTAPTAKATLDPPSAPPDSAGEPPPSAVGTLSGENASGSGSGRSAGAAAEVGGAGTGPAMAAPGGARLVLALPGDGRGAVPAEYGPYLARFRRSVEDALVYPLAARRQGLAGRVELDVLLEPGGRVTAVEIHMSSSHAVLDEAGIAAVRSLPPLPLPEGLPRRPLRIRLPLDFQLR